jgi:hypothetical protein
MVMKELPREQPKEPETVAVDATVREVRRRKTAKARAKSLDNKKARREVTQDGRQGSPENPFIGRLVDPVSVG